MASFDSARVEDLDRDGLQRELRRLLTANRELEDELESLAYSVSHDLRAPLRAVSGFARILREDHAPSLSDGATEVIDVIERNAAKMNRRLDALLALSRVGRHSVEAEAVEMKPLARRVWDDLTEDSNDGKLHLEDLPVVDGDPELLEQVWENLLNNAIKFSGEAPPHVRIWADHGDHGVMFHVRDEGVGFDPRHADQLFVPFQRLHAATEFQGTGVGLALVKKIVRRHGGRVWGESDDSGATFHFTLTSSSNRDDA